MITSSPGPRPKAASPQTSALTLAATDPVLAHALAHAAHGPVAGIAMLVDDEDLVRACTADMLTEIGSLENVPDFVKSVKEGKGLLQGFGHRVYKNFDPRATVLRATCHEVLDQLGDVRDEPLL